MSLVAIAAIAHQISLIRIVRFPFATLSVITGLLFARPPFPGLLLTLSPRTSCAPRRVGKLGTLSLLTLNLFCPGLGSQCFVIQLVFQQTPANVQLSTLLRARKRNARTHK